MSGKAAAGTDGITVGPRASGPALFPTEGARLEARGPTVRSALLLFLPRRAFGRARAPAALGGTGGAGRGHAGDLDLELRHGELGLDRGAGRRLALGDPGFPFAVHGRVVGHVGEPDIGPEDLRFVRTALAQ